MRFANCPMHPDHGDLCFRLVQDVQVLTERWNDSFVLDPAPCSPIRPFSAQPNYQSTSPVTQKVKDSLQPFSKPGPFAPARPTNGHVLDCNPSAQLHMACNTKVFPVVERDDTASVLSFRAPATSRMEGHLCPVQSDGEQFRILETIFFIHKV